MTMATATATTTHAPSLLRARSSRRFHSISEPRRSVTLTLLGGLS